MCTVVLICGLDNIICMLKTQPELGLGGLDNMLKTQPELGLGSRDLPASVSCGECSRLEGVPYCYCFKTGFY